MLSALPVHVPLAPAGAQSPAISPKYVGSAVCAQCNGDVSERRSRPHYVLPRTMPKAEAMKAEGNTVCTQCHPPAGNPRFPAPRRAECDVPVHLTCPRRPAWASTGGAGPAATIAEEVRTANPASEESRGLASKLKQAAGQ